MSQNERVVIIGAGQGGGETVATLRQAGFDGKITLIGDEAIYPYSRPPLSKTYLKGETTAEDLLLRHTEVYERNAIEVMASTRATAIDTRAQTVTLNEGESLPYDHLVLATGGRARTIPELEDAGNVHYMRTKTDADNLHDRMHPGAHALVIGGGYIGLEFAAVARSRSVEATLLEAAPRLLARVSSKPISAFYLQQHTKHGVDIVLNAQISGYRYERGDVSAVELSDGRVIPVDFVLVGIGLVPNTELAEAASLEVNNGIVVDKHLRTSIPNVYAIGDVSCHPVPGTGEMRRLESVPNASAQARIVANAIVGVEKEYDALPWFWSDQYDIKLQLAGVPNPEDQVVVRGDPENDHKFIVLHLKDDVVTCAEVVNDPAGFAQSKKLISMAAKVDIDILRNPEQPLKTAAV